MIVLLEDYFYLMFKYVCMEIVMIVHLGELSQLANWNNSPSIYEPCPTFAFHCIYVNVIQHTADIHTLDVHL